MTLLLQDVHSQNMTKMFKKFLEAIAKADITLNKSKSALKPIDESLPFKVECDVSDVAISAALNEGSVHV